MSYNEYYGIDSWRLVCPQGGALVDGEVVPWDNSMCDPSGNFDEGACTAQWGGYYTEWLGNEVSTGPSHCVQYAKYGNTCCHWGQCHSDIWDDVIRPISMGSPNRDTDGTISEHISDVNYTLWFFDDK